MATDRSACLPTDQGVSRERASLSWGTLINDIHIFWQNLPFYLLSATFLVLFNPCPLSSLCGRRIRIALSGGGDISFSLAVLKFCYTSLHPSVHHIRHLALASRCFAQWLSLCRSSVERWFWRRRRRRRRFEGQFAGKEYFHIVKILPFLPDLLSSGGFHI